MALPRLPANPLAEVLDEMVRRLPPQNQRQRSINTFAIRCGFCARSLREWREPGKTMQFGRADSILTELGLLFHDVWPPEDYPEVWKALEGRR